MPGGRASHKGSADKPNVNAEGVIGDASDKSVEPEDLLPEDLTNTETLRTDEYVNYPPAIQRPDEDINSSHQNK